MPSDAKTEHFITLFDRHFIPLGLSLHSSLLAQAEPFMLWVLALDRETEDALLSLSLPHLTVIPLRDIETPDLQKVKSERSLVEYFWTLSPFTFQAVFDREPGAGRVTYLDADLFFFNKPSLVLEELDRSGRDVLLTEHNYDPRYDQTTDAGRFCVQFITVRRTPGGLTAMKWWQEQCLEWCFNRVEDGKFGDQRYLDQWPALFGNSVHVLERKDLAVAPWNADYFAAQGLRHPAFFHFHGLRIVSAHRIRLSTYYRIGSRALGWYKRYARELCGRMAFLEQKGIPLRFINPEPTVPRLMDRRRLKRIFLKKTEHWAVRPGSGSWNVVL